MNNISDNRDSNYCILPKNHLKYDIDSSNYKNTVVLIHLHYDESFERFCRYIDNIPDEISILFTTSNEVLIKKISKYILNRSNCELIYKENRGRDISSFLVACKDRILTYDYFCFIHDKCEKNVYMKNDIDQWLYSQWENMLGSRCLIYNIINCLANKEIGILLPPKSFSNNLNNAIVNNWDGNFENTLLLSKRLNLNAEISIDKSPMAIGTVFWANVDVVKKLLLYKWSYEDFITEPLPNNATISHAIERIFEYLAQDSGYKCKWLCNDLYAAQLIENYQVLAYNSFELLRNNIGIHDINDIENIIYNKKKMKKELTGYSVYIYGAGDYAKECYRFLKFCDINIDAFIVTDKSTEKKYNQCPIITVADYCYSPNDKIIIAVNNKHHDQIISSIKEKNVSYNNILYWHKNN